MNTPASDADRGVVRALLGRDPKTEFEVCVRHRDGTPVVIRNAPFERDGTPMPTRYWLLPSSRAAIAIGRIESGGGVRRAEVEVATSDIEAAHRAYAIERDAAIPADHVGPRPMGGIGGTRRGCKCLHAHYAHLLAGGVDAVGTWVEAQLTPAERDR